MTLGQRLKHLRHERGETQDHTAKKLGIQRSTYGEYERGKITPPTDKLFHLAAHFNVAADYLLGHTTVRDVPAKRDIAYNLTLFLEWLESGDPDMTFEGTPVPVEARPTIATTLESARSIIRSVVTGRG